MECIAALLAEVKASQEAMQAEQKALKHDVETSQKENQNGVSIAEEPATGERRSQSRGEVQSLG